MASSISSSPSRLQHLSSAEGTSGPSQSDPPPPSIKRFIDTVIETPLDDIGKPLSNFIWKYNKGNFNHWRMLFSHFGDYFKARLSLKEDLILSEELSDSFPKSNIIKVLNVMQRIIENSPNRSSFPEVEHFKLLLASTDPEILIATLSTLYALVKINPSKLHVSGKLIGVESVNSYLLSLAQGWGGKEEGLDIYTCATSHKRITQDKKGSESQFGLGSTLHFELHAQNTTRSRLIDISDLRTEQEDDLLRLEQFVKDNNLPKEHRFSLLTRIRYARSLCCPHTHSLENYGTVSLLAFIVLGSVEWC
ncbi:E3 ubiquitin-protein ligase UPL2-like isoform X3 [Papaver somniferum]|uniref:E3 ubiquitin-protein ligase UPL2-like isoform X3 n=1 Tax=Papaver somniferum TaxID=3469 RepID=UPI000E6F78A0|nr:E3 ubiquitin-protein ligase UPL2-like isoform X3 [Papaver somniferum]